MTGFLRWRRRAPLVVAMAVLLPVALFGRRAIGDSGMDDDGVPRGTVAFFSGDVTRCPAGWILATQTTGRLVVGVQAAIEVGRSVGAPLANQEDRKHVHTYKANLQLDEKAIAGADGANREGAQSGMYPLSGAVEASSSGLPFVQLLACERQ